MQVWAEYDPNGTKYIATDKVKDLLRSLQPPLGLGPQATDVRFAEQLVCFGWVIKPVRQ